MDLQQNKATAYAEQENRNMRHPGRPKTTFKHGELHPKMWAKLSVKAQDCGAWLNQPEIFIEPLLDGTDALAPLGWLEGRYPHLATMCSPGRREAIIKLSAELESDPDKALRTERYRYRALCWQTEALILEQLDIKVKVSAAGGGDIAVKALGIDDHKRVRAFLFNRLPSLTLKRIEGLTMVLGE